MTPTSTATTVLDHLRAGRYTEIRDLFAPGLRELVTPESVQTAWTAEISKHGPITGSGTPVADEPGPGGTLVRVPLTFEHGQATLLVTVTDPGSLAGIQIGPAEAARPIEPWQPPGYADPAAFEEREVTVGPVGGTLTLPVAPGPHPGVVLLAGSGPQDRDETIGRNKPFKDLAWGLATRGIAVLRFDKIRGDELGDHLADFTVEDEYLHPAAAAVELLGRHAGRVFVLGHSLGGSVAPRVGAATPAVAGLVILAGGAQPLHWAAVRQVRYLAGLDPAGAAAAQPVIDRLTRQAELIDSPALSPATPPADLPFGAPAAYWLDLRASDPPSIAAALAKPMLILQGGRDYQATVADDLSRWEAALATRDDVTIRVLDADNHLFFPGRGPSTPAEYEPAQHVDPEVVDVIAGWLHGLA